MTIEGLQLVIPFKELTDNGLTLEQWFILYCVYTNQQEVIETYIDKCTKIDIGSFKGLLERGYIGLTSNKDIKYPDISLSTKGKELFSKSQIVKNNIEFEDCFKELRSTYPNKVPSDNGTMRFLQGNLERCRKLYHKIITDLKGNINVELHNKILLAIRKQYNDALRGRKLPYFQNLATYLHQQNYQPYLEDDQLNVKEEKDWFGDDI